LLHIEIHPAWLRVTTVDSEFDPTKFKFVESSEVGTETNNFVSLKI